MLSETSYIFQKNKSVRVMLLKRKIMKAFIVLFCIIAFVFAEHVEKDFGAFKATYNKKYQTIPEVIIRRT